MISGNRKGEMLAAAASKYRYWPAPRTPRLTLGIIQGESHLFGWTAGATGSIEA